MAESRIVRNLDEKLVADGTVPKEYLADYGKIHSMLNTFMRRYGGALSDKNFKEGEKKLRDYLMVLHKKGASQEKLTAYLRIGLAHLSFDYIASNDPSLGTDDLIYRSLQSFKQRKFHKTFFKVAPTKDKERISIKKR